jgi:hypothetical protein
MFTGMFFASSALPAFAEDLNPDVRVFIIGSQSLPKAVNLWADQAGMQVLWSSGEAATSKIAPKVEGHFPPQTALQLLLEGSGFICSFIDGKTVSIQPDSSPVSGAVTPPPVSPTAGTHAGPASARPKAVGAGQEHQ